MSLVTIASRRQQRDFTTEVKRMLSFLSMIKHGVGRGPANPADEMMPKATTSTSTPPILTTPTADDAELSKYERRFSTLPSDPVYDPNTAEGRMAALGHFGNVDYKNTSSQPAPAAWKKPLAGALRQIAAMAKPQDDDFLPPPEMQGIIPRPHPIPYQPIPYQAPILRRY